MNGDPASMPPVSDGMPSACGNAAPTSARHLPVLLEEVMEALAPQRHGNDAGRYLDGTVGLGGHAEALLSRSGSATELCGLDRDSAALALAADRLKPFGDRVHLVQSRYSGFAHVLAELGWDGLDGALIDIGVSSMQIDEAERGFSFHADGPLDMRMNPKGGEAPASRLVNRASVEELKDLIARYGEDPQAGRIARAIVDARAKKPLETTRELAAVVENAYPPAWRRTARIHPATRTFQALRMATNDELGELEQFMDSILAHMNPGGRVAVIAFHSLEDRVVKQRMRAWAQGCVCGAQSPVCVCGHRPEARILTQRPLTASAAELAVNPRASSAKLRVAEKLAPGEVDAPPAREDGKPRMARDRRLARGGRA